MKLFKVLIVVVLTIAMPISQARAVVPDVSSVLSDVTESTDGETHISGSESGTGSGVKNVENIVPSQDLAKPSTIIPSDVLQETPTTEELLEAQDQDLGGHYFWTGRKVGVITISVLLLGLLLLLAGGGGGDGIFGSGGGGGGDNNESNFRLSDGSELPHHPEPSTFLLMGLGLLIPFLRKRSL